MTQTALVKIDPRMIGRVTISGTHPQYWFPWGGYVVIEPVPDAAYPLLLYVSDFPSEVLEDDTDTPTDLPDEFHPCVVDFALYVLSLKHRKWAKAVMYHNGYIRNLKKRKKEYIERKAEKRAIHKIPVVVKSGLRKEVDTQSTHRIPDRVVYRGGSPWAH